MKDKLWILLGIFLFSFVIGTMTGASNSPVAGGVISSFFGIAIAMVGLFSNKEAELKLKLNVIGGGLVLLSIGLLVGIYAGIQYRNSDPISSSDKVFIWEGQKPPTSTYEAIDWVLTNDLLISRGFTRAQVQSIYQIRLKEINSRDSALKIDPTAYSNDDKYSKETPYYKMIISSYKSSIGRYIANDPNAKKEEVF